MGSLIDILSGVFYQPWLLAALAALVVPPLIHLLNRRRHDVVDWGAMQFLQVGEAARRRLFLEEILLMAVRMALIALLVLAVAGPFVTSTTLARLAPQGNRDVVLIFDGSTSMSASDRGRTAHEAAQQWARSFLDERQPGDSVALLQAREQIVPVLEPLSRDLDRARQQIDRLPPPTGEIDWRPALRQALALLEHSQRAEREIILLTDGQRHGWADRDSLFRWQLLAGELASGSAPSRPPPRLWAVNVVPDRSARLPTWSLAPLETTRPLVPVDQEVRFRTAIELHGQARYAPPYRIHLEIDGKWVRDLEAPRSAALEDGKVPLDFAQRFATPGSHLVTVQLEPDPPPDERPEGYVVRDAVAADNRQDIAVEVVPAVPVLLIANEPPSGRRRNFLRDALTPANDPSPAVQVRLIPAADFGPASLNSGGPRPRVLILDNVARLTPPQQQAVEQFLAGGGGVLLTLGDRVDRDAYNEQLHQQGKGWLPAHLEGTLGDENDLEKAAHPEPGAAHPALDLFRARAEATSLPQLAEARFPRWWKLSTPGQGSTRAVVSLLRSPAGVSPFLVEGQDPERAGRVLVCAVPLDDSWGSNVVRTGVFVPLVHELVYYLAGAHTTAFNLHPGQPLRWALDAADGSAGFTLQSPSGDPRPVVVGGTAKEGIPALLDPQARGAILRIEGQRESGVYRLKTPAGQTVYYVLRPRGNEESDLTPCSDEDRQRVADLVPGLAYESRLEPLADRWVSEQHRQDLWWWLLLGLIVLLCAEVWMTRRMVKRQEVA